jgi:hypothetical protein
MAIAPLMMAKLEKQSAMILVVRAVGFIVTCWQAYLAQNISSEYSESKYLGIAVYSLLQLCVVGVPVLLLIEASNVSVRYSLWVGIIFVLCMSMMLVVFVPLLIQQWKKQEPCHVLSVVSLQNPIANSTSRETSEILRPTRIQVVQQITTLPAL